MTVRSFVLAALFVLGACAYSLEGTMREVKIVTPGAHDAVCSVYVDGLRWRIYPPQTVKYPQSKEDMVIDCRAPGNRRKKIVVDSDLSVYGLFNIANAGVGMAWDLLSGAAYIYPRHIAVDFTDVEQRPMSLPAHNNPDIKQPEEYELEEFLPGHPRLNSDKYAIQHQLRRRQAPGEELSFVESNDAIAVQTKGDLMTVIEDLRNQIDPTKDTVPADDSPPSSGPVPLFQGE